jgi:hypothetical protein
MIAPAVEGIDLFKIAGRSMCGVDSQPQDGHGFPCPAAIPQNNTPNNTFVSRRDYRHGAMLPVDRARGTDGSDRLQEGQGHVKRNQLRK